MNKNLYRINLKLLAVDIIETGAKLRRITSNDQFFEQSNSIIENLILRLQNFDGQVLPKSLGYNIRSLAHRNRRK